MPSRRRLGGAGLVAAAATAAAGAAVAGVLGKRQIVGRRGQAPNGPAGQRYGRLPADRSYTVTADDGVGLHVEEVGPLDAPLVVVFAHGYTLALGSWHFQRLGLGTADDPVVRLVFFDQRSHGRSPRAPADSCQIDQLGRDLAAVLRAAAEELPVVLVGHSMGGMAVMALAEQQPERFGTQVLAVALLSTTTAGLADLDLGLPKSLSRLKLAVLPVLVRGMRACPRLAELTRRSGAELARPLTRWYSFGGSSVDPALDEYVGQLIAGTHIEVIADFFGTLLGHDRVRALPVLRQVDMLVVCGDNDRLTPLAHSLAMAAELPAARLVVVPGAGHLAMMERPELINHELHALISRAAQRALTRPAARRAPACPAAEPARPGCRRDPA